MSGMPAKAISSSLLAVGAICSAICAAFELGHTGFQQR